jgi:hypothetical protein
MKISRALAASASASAVVLGLALGGCATAGPKSIAPDFVPPKTIALLPLANASSNADAPEMMRSIFYQALADRGYDVLAPEMVDGPLQEKFSTIDGNEVKKLDAVKLGEALGVDAVMYGTVMAFQFQNVGVYENKEVELGFKLVDAHTGRLLWEQQKDAWDKELKTSAKAAGRLFIKGLKERFMDSPLAKTADKAVRWTILTLPPGPGPRSARADAGPKSTSSSTHHSETTVDEESSESSIK